MQESTSTRIAQGVVARRYFFLILFTAIYALCAIGRASGKPFWYDEIITLIAAKSPDLATTWKATMVTDANPPLPQMLTHLSIRWFGLSELTARLPAIAGFWIFCVCLCVFVGRRAGAIWGLCALLMPTMTRAYYYSAEARGYGPELGFCGLALVAWQSAARAEEEGRGRMWALCGLSVSLAATLFCHYYGILIYLPLVGAELVRARERRRLDFAVAGALALGVAPLVWRAATILGVVKGATRSWTEAYLRQGLEFWESGLAPGAAFAVLLLMALAVFARRAGKTADAPRIPDYEWAAAVLFALIPLAGVVGGLVATHMFNERYALIGLTGFCLLAPMLGAEFLGRRSAAGVAMLAVLGWGMIVRSLDHPYEGNPFAGEPVLREALERGPVVIPDGQLFLQMWHYTPEAYKSRLIFVMDDDAALKYMGYTTIDGGVRALRGWANVNIVEWADFVRGTHEFTAYQTVLRPGWVLPRVVAEGATVEVRKTALFRELVNVKLR